MSIGIYKITNPKGKIYIGQSIQIEKRWKYYISESYNKRDHQNKLFNSLKKYGPENHKFEILEECTVEQLNKKEIYWGRKYNCTCPKIGLNLRELGKQGVWTKEAKEKISKAKLGKSIHTEASKKSISEKLTGRKLTKEQSSRCGRKKGTSNPKGGSKKGWKRTKESKSRISQSKSGTKYKYSPHLNKRVKINQYDLEGNFIKTWDSVTELISAIPKVNTRVFSGKQKYSDGFIFIPTDKSTQDEILKRVKAIKKSTLIKYGYIKTR